MITIPINSDSAVGSLTIDSLTSWQANPLPLTFTLPSPQTFNGLALFAVEIRTPGVLGAAGRLALIEVTSPTTDTQSVEFSTAQMNQPIEDGVSHRMLEIIAYGASATIPHRTLWLCNLTLQADPSSSSLTEGPPAVGDVNLTRAVADGLYEPIGGGGAAWGGITGTLASQTDLSNALDLKAPLAGPTFTGNANFFQASVEDQLRLAGDVNFAAGVTFTYGAGAAAAHRTALGLGTLATTTPGTNVATFLATPSSANLAAAVTDETGSDALVFQTSPTFKTSLKLNNPANTFAYTFTPAAIAANYNLTLPLLVGNDTLAVLGGSSQTFTATQYFNVGLYALSGNGVFSNSGAAYIGIRATGGVQKLYTTTAVDIVVSPGDSPAATFKATTHQVQLAATLKLASYTVGTLPAAATAGAGATAYVTDAFEANYGATVASGGSVKLKVTSDGTNWKMM